MSKKEESSHVKALSVQGKIELSTDSHPLSSLKARSHFQLKHFHLEHDSSLAAKKNQFIRQVTSVGESAFTTIACCTYDFPFTIEKARKNIFLYTFFAQS